MKIGKMPRRGNGKLAAESQRCRGITPVANTNAAYDVSMRRHGDYDDVTLPSLRNSPQVHKVAGSRMCTCMHGFGGFLGHGRRNAPVENTSVS